MSKQPNLGPIIPRKKWSPYTKTKWKSEKGLSEGFTEIARKYGVSLTAVWDVCNRYTYQNSAQSLLRSGRPHKLRAIHKRHLWQFIKFNFFISIGKLIELCCLHIFKWT